MRSYWIKIGLGALAIFAIGMVGISIVRGGIARVHNVVEGTGPISIPLAFIPFKLEGEKLGTLERVTMLRETPRRVVRVNLEVKLSDSLLARGLGGCRLAANLDEDRSQRRVKLDRGPFTDGAFWCIRDSAPTGYLEYGQASFNPGEVTVPLYLTQDLVDELQNLDFHDEPDPPIENQEASEAELDSIIAVFEVQADSVARVVRRRVIDSLRGEGLRRADSVRRALNQMAESLPRR